MEGETVVCRLSGCFGSSIWALRAAAAGGCKLYKRQQSKSLVSRFKSCKQLNLLSLFVLSCGLAYSLILRAPHLTCKTRPGLILGVSVRVCKWSGKYRAALHQCAVQRLDTMEYVQHKHALAFNPTLVALQRNLEYSTVLNEESISIFMSFRLSHSMWGPSDIHAVVMDLELMPLRKTILITRARQLQKCSWLEQFWREDPRFFIYQNRLWMAYSATKALEVITWPHHIYSERQAVSMLDKHLQLRGDIFPTLGFNSQFQTTGLKWEKNWGFFERQGRLHVLYTITPNFTIYSFEKSDVTLSHPTLEVSYLASTIDETILRGGSAPVLVGGTWHCFVHSAEAYQIYLVTFQDLTLAMTHIVKLPLNMGTLFPSGALFDMQRDAWIISAGWQDMQILIFHVQHSLLQSLQQTHDELVH